MSEPPLSPLEIERAVDALARQRAIRREPWATEQLNRIFGRSGRSLSSTLQHLVALGLLAEERNGRWTLTQTGAKVVDARTGGDWGPLTVQVLRVGSLERDVLAFLGEATLENEQARLLQARTKTIAPGLAAVASWQPAWRCDDEFVVPLHSLQTAMAGAAMEIADGVPDWVEDRARVGHRAEAYSLRLEREQHGPGAILHVARDEGDRYGYDLEDVSVAPSRLIECKGSRSLGLSFVMSANELAVAGKHPDQYEIHFWGGIELSRSPEQDYATLRRSGHPIVISDPAGAIERGELVADATAWSLRPGSAVRGTGSLSL